MSKRIITTTLVAGALLAAAPRPAAADASAEQIKAVEDCLSGVWSPPARYLDSVYASRDLAKAKSCAAAAKAVLDAGGPAREIKVPGAAGDKTVPIAREDGGKRYARIDEVHKLTGTRHDEYRVAYIRGSVEKGQQTLDWYDTLQEVGEDEWIRLRMDGDRCTAMVDEAAAMGLGADVPIEVKAGLTIPFGQIKAKVCAEVVGLAGAVKTALGDKVKADLDKQLAPFRKLLGGDKIKTYVDKGMYELEVYTKGGALMESPQHFKDASLWFLVLQRTDDLGRDWWTLRRFQFKGDKLIKITESTGQGRNPPSSKYR